MPREYAERLKSGEEIRFQFKCKGRDIFGKTYKRREADIKKQQFSFAI